MSIKKIIQRLPKFGKKKKRKVVKVLSIDGGGIRGIIPAMILNRLEQLAGKPTCEMFDLIAGSSAGGIVALLLAKPDENGDPEYAAHEVADLFEYKGSQIFSNSTVWEQIKSVRSLMEKKYSAAGLESVLQEYLGETMLNKSLTDVLIPTYEIQRRTACFFKSTNARMSPEFDVKMRYIARATSAAPTYFEPAEVDIPTIEEPFVLIDGGIVANNPAMCAYIEAKNMFPDADDIIVVSIGTGELLRNYTYDEAKRWGLAGWVNPIVDFLFHGSAVTVDYQLKELLPTTQEKGRQYYRFQLKLTDDIAALDDTRPQTIQTLKSIVNEEILDAQHYLLKELALKL